MGDDDDIRALQEEELEVLNSIYEGDPAFSSPTAKSFQYKFGEDGACKSFILEVTWGEKYPNEFPTLSLDTFYNRHVLDQVKANIVDRVKSEAEQYLGMSMTYSLFEFCKEHLEELLEEQPDQIQEITERVRSVAVDDAQDDDGGGKSKQKKTEQLSKSQKRRMWDKGGIDSEERPRGWDWVDVIRHLSQTGGKEATT